jgi:hypothetical protein
MASCAFSAPNNQGKGQGTVPPPMSAFMICSTIGTTCMPFRENFELIGSMKQANKLENQ